MIRLILFGTFFFVMTNKRQLDAARELYNQPPDVIRPPVVNVNQLNSGRPSKTSYSRDKSPTFMQSRRFHPDQLARDMRDLNQPSSFTSQISTSYFYTYGGPGTSLASSSQEGCRLTDQFCSRDYHCCSGKCRCVKWSIIGKTSCWKKCF